LYVEHDRDYIYLEDVMKTPHVVIKCYGLVNC